MQHKGSAMVGSGRQPVLPCQVKWGGGRRHPYIQEGDRGGRPDIMGGCRHFLLDLD